MTDDESMLLDELQDLGAWILFCGTPAFAISVVGFALGWWRT